MIGLVDGETEGRAVYDPSQERITNAILLLSELVHLAQREVGDGSIMIIYYISIVVSAVETRRQRQTCCHQQDES